jgi:DNA polymerase elongation subunit (family B)
MPVFQILDSFAQDICVERETETEREISYINDDYYDSDGEVIQRRKKPKTAAAAAGPQRREMVIHLFGKTAAGELIRMDVQGFEPFFFVKVPTTMSPAAFRSVFAAEKFRHPVDITFEKRKVLFGYTGDAEYLFAKLSVKSLQAFRDLRGLFLTKEGAPCFSPRMSVYEATLDPMLRFFHLRNIKPCGWVTTDADDTTAWDNISPCDAPPAPTAKFLTAYWDIECYSENGEFPLPKKGYERVAKLLFEHATSAAAAADLLLGAALYPSNPPTGMDPLRPRSGRLPDRKQLEAALKTDGFLKLDNYLGRELDSDDAIPAILDCLKAWIRLLPLAGDPAIQIGVVLQNGHDAPENHIFVLDTCDKIEGAQVYSYRTEKEMILGWAAHMDGWNADILVGYNVFGFDEKYIWTRIQELGIETDPAVQALTRLLDVGKNVQLDEKFLSSSALGDNTMYILSTHGRLQVDLYHYIKRSFSLASYKLDDVCQHFMSGSLDQLACMPGQWMVRTKTTSDLVEGRYIVLQDETGDSLVDKLRIKSIIQGQAIMVDAPTGDDAADLEITAAAAVKWSVVKDDVSPQEIFRLHRGSSADRARVAAYCIQDCVLVMELYKKLDVFNNAMAMANACSVPVSYIFTRGQGVKIESLIYKECYERNQSVETLANPSSAEAEESYEGAIVLDPVPGFYFDSPIGVADFASLYPSTIISENISYDTLVWVKNFSLDGKFLGYSFGSEEHEAYAPPGTAWTDITFDIWGTKEGDKRKVPEKVRRGMRVCRYAQLPSETKGTLPQIVQKLLATRKAKRKQAETEPDAFKKALLDAEQLAYKLTANSLYGQLGSPTFKIRLQHLAASVTAYGRKQILFAKAAIEKFYGPDAKDPRCSAQMVYGDTDSLFVNFNVRDPATGEALKGKEAVAATIALTEEAGKFVTRALKAPHDFEYDKVFHPFIIFSKKRYVGNKYEDSPDHFHQTSMGIATKRRDYAPLVKLIYGGALQILLSDRNIGLAIQFVKDKLTDLVEGRMSLNMLTMSKSLRAEYKTPSPPAHKVLAERMRLRDEGTAPASGERVQFIYILPPPGQQSAKLQGDRVEHPSYIREKGLKPDYKFYIEHQLTNPIVQLFSLVVEQIPGVPVPAAGWKRATNSEREMAAWSALFQPAITLCDRISTRKFGEAVFGITTTPVVKRELRSSLRLATSGATSGATSSATSSATGKPKVQAKLSLFAEKQMSKRTDESRKKVTADV